MNNLRSSNPALKGLDRILGRGLPLVFFVYHALERPWRKIFPAPMEPRTIFIIKLCCFGDAVLALPAIRSISRRYPMARITVLTSYRANRVFQSHEFIHQVIVLPLRGTENPLHPFFPFRAFKSLLPLFPCLIRGADLVIDFDLYFCFTAFFTLFLGAPRRCGFNLISRKRIVYTHTVARPPDRPEFECFFDLAKLVDAVPDYTFLDFPVPQAVMQECRDFLKQHGVQQGDRVVLLFPGASPNWPEKKWPLGFFYQVIERLNCLAGVRVAVMDDLYDQHLFENLHSLGNASFIELRGKHGDYNHLIGYMKQCHVFLTNDTGPMHLAGVMGISTVALFGPTSEKKWLLFGRSHRILYRRLECRPCYYLSRMPRCEHRECLEKLGVNEVFEAIRERLT